MDAVGGKELVKKIQELEAGQELLKKEMSKLMSPVASQLRGRSPSKSPRRPPAGASGHASRLQRDSCHAGGASSVVGLSEKQYLKVLQNMGQSVHVLDLDGRIIYWNRSAERLYGYSASEILGQYALNVLVDAGDVSSAKSIIQRIFTGESWTGKFPVVNKSGERFSSIFNNTPFYDDDGRLLGIICVSSDSLNFEDFSSPSTSGRFNIDAGGSSSRPQICSGSERSSGELQQRPLQTSIASKITNLATKVRSKVRSSQMSTGDDGTKHEAAYRDSSTCRHDASSAEQREDATSSEASTPKDDAQHGVFRRVYSSADDSSPRKSTKGKYEDPEGKLGFHKIVSSKAEAFFGKNLIAWPWKGQEHGGADAKNRFAWPWSSDEQEPEHGQPKSADSNVGSLYSLNTNNTSSVSSTGSVGGSSALHKVDSESDCLDYEIFWEDLLIGEQIGRGSCGTVYHALWYGSDVAVKVFSKQEYSDDVIYAFRQEVSLMKNLRHPNIILFMGAVTTPQRLCIITEFLPRGCLFRLLQRNTKLDWRRRIQIAIDIARGMNYLHHCNPPIIHRDLKSSNLLVDKNWTVKVADFGLSRLKHETFLTTKSGKGTPQWMAPEVLRNEPSDEKSDVYSYSVILWELVTHKIPWENLNSMQVIGAVGFMNQKLDIPNDLDPQWASIISSCFNSDPQSRPAFQDLLERFRCLQRQLQAEKSTAGDGARSAAGSPRTDAHGIAEFTDVCEEHAEDEGFQGHFSSSTLRKSGTRRLLFTPEAVHYSMNNAS